MPKLKPYTVEVESPYEDVATEKFKVLPLVKYPAGAGPNWTIKRKPGLKFSSKKAVKNYFMRKFGRKNVNVI